MKKKTIMQPISIQHHQYKHDEGFDQLATAKHNILRIIALIGRFKK